MCIRDRGTQIPRVEIVEILKMLEMEIEDNEALKVKVPSFRRDLEREIDLIEEIARIYGYWKIPADLPAGGGMDGGLSGRQRLEERMIDALSAQGLSLIHISEPTRLGMISYAVFCLKK